MGPVINYLVVWFGRNPSVAAQDRMINTLYERYGRQGLDAWATALRIRQSAEVD